ncbi:MAG: hypothetical protein LIO93_03120 [Bacteroidales bacterium]|nr:hypothetical protein [Bacteroidales bacterium]
MGTKNRQKNILLLKDVPSTDWELRERGTGGGFYHVIAVKPLTEAYPSVHMGNSGFEYSAVFEGDSYGYGANSQFRFVEYFDPGISVSTDSINFQYRQPGEEPQIDLNVLGFPSLTGKIKVELLNNDSEVFTELLGDAWSDTEGGEIYMFFTPPAGTTTVTEYNAILRISGQTATEDITIDVKLKGTAVPTMPFLTSPTVTPSAEDKWYAIRFSARTGGYMQDLGSSTEGINIVSTMLTSREDDSFQWKFVDVDGTNFKLVSKLGNQVEWRQDVYSEDPTTGERTKDPGYFYTTSTSENTFRFTVRPTDGLYEIKWNEAKTFDGTADSTAYFNKSNVNESVIHFTSLSDVGSLMEYFPIENAPLSNVLEFSEGDDETWYYVMFQRVLGKIKNTNVGIKNDGLGATVTQDTIIRDDASFQWKLVGDKDVARFVSRDGYELGNITDENGNPTEYSKTLVEEGEGNEYQVLKFKNNFNRTYGVESWQLLNITDAERTGNYINDFGGGSNAVGEYGVFDDGGNELIFVKVENFFFMDIEDITPGEELNDPVVNTSYYSIQGIQFAKLPKAEGFYIEKNVHASGKVSSVKLYVPGQAK